MNSPIAYLGGKSRLAKTIIARIPKDHECYCEPFCGAAWVFFQKDPSGLEVINDADAELRHVAISYALSRLHEGEEDSPPDPRYVAAFTRLLKDPSADIRQMAVSAVAQAGLTQAPKMPERKAAQGARVWRETAWVSSWRKRPLRFSS